MLLAGIMLAALLLAGCTSADTARRMRMGVAGEGGVYHAFGEGFAALENDSGNGAVELKNTAGSAANLRLLMKNPDRPSIKKRWHRQTLCRMPTSRAAFFRMRRWKTNSVRSLHCIPRPVR